MNLIVGFIFAFLAYLHVRDLIDPNRMDRARVRWNSATLAMVFGFLAYLWIFAPVAA